MPKVTVILTHHLDSVRPYLDLAIQGLVNQEFKDFNVLLVSDAESKPRDALPPSWRSHWDGSLDTSAKKVKWALQNSDSEFVVQHSDDVIMSWAALGELAAACEALPSIMNPFSNSDCRSLYYSNIFATRKDESKHLIHDMSIEDVKGWESEILNFPLGRRVLFPVQTLSFFCTIMPRHVWNRVGDLDPELEYRHNDQDFCLRAAQIGIPSAVNLAPFVFHFGSKTLNECAPEDIRAKASHHFRAKWGIQ